jgi:hypothetical protein
MNENLNILVEFSTQNTESIEDAHLLYLYESCGQPVWDWDVCTKKPTEQPSLNHLKIAADATARIEKILGHLEKQ